MRERLTITLKQEILDALDAEIDGKRLRNRSHAIEYFLGKSLGTEAVKVLLLAGGKPADFAGTSEKVPKGMVTIAGKSLLEHTLQRLKIEKFNEVVVSVGEGGQAIENYFGRGENIGVDISYLHQKGMHLGTAGALFQSKSIMQNGTFVVWYGDVLSDIDLNDLVEFHREQKNVVCTMALTSVESPKMWGVARLNGSRIISFEEKPKNLQTFSHLINAGIYVMEPEIFRYLSQESGKLESSVFPRLAEEGRLCGFPFEGLWLDISSSAAYRQAVQEITDKKTY